MEKKQWYITEFTDDGYDCCDCKIGLIRIDNDIAAEYRLGQKYFKLPCPKCGQIGSRKRFSWGVGSENELYNSHQTDPVPIRSIPDMTEASLRAKIGKLKTDIAVKREWVVEHKKEIGEISKLLSKEDVASMDEDEEFKQELLDIWYEKPAEEEQR